MKNKLEGGKKEKARVKTSQNNFLLLLIIILSYAVMNSNCLRNNNDISSIEDCKVNLDNKRPRSFFYSNYPLNLKQN